MNIYVTGNRALALLRESRRGGAAPLCEETAAVAAPLVGDMPSLEGLARVAPLSLADVSESRPIDVVFPDAGARHHSTQLRGQVCGAEREGSFVRLGVSPRDLEEAGLPNDLRIYIDSPGRIFLVAAQSLSRYVQAGRIGRYEAFFRLLSLGSELCGTYARHPADPHGEGVEFLLPQVAKTGDIAGYLSLCKGARGLPLAADAARHLAGGLRSPLEAELYYALTLPPRLGGIAFPKPLVNEPLESGKGAAAGTRYEPTFSPYDKITPDMQWPLPDQGLVVEVDGYLSHSGRESFVGDRLRDQDYKACGYQVLRVTFENMADAAALEKTLALVIGVAEPWLSESRVANLRRNLRNRRASELRATLTSVMGPSKKTVSSD